MPRPMHRKRAGKTIGLKHRYSAHSSPLDIEKNPLISPDGYLIIEFGVGAEFFILPPPITKRYRKDLFIKRRADAIR
ncbi:hypothetical protein [Diaphorobacter ruginosibacter]|uniref:hypothetical protein n=1 Tax=Diaphorobacter ruginosibacter TaxID=1715720 RepID=UPI0033428239